MKVSTLALLIVGALLLCAAVPLRSAYLQRSLYLTDIASLLAPSPAFLLALHFFNLPAHIGWAGFIYPFLVLGAAVLLMYLRVFLLPLTGVRPRYLSWACLCLAIACATALGAWVPPWYD